MTADNLEHAPRWATWPPAGKSPGWKARVATALGAIVILGCAGWMVWRVQYGDPACPLRKSAAPRTKVGDSSPVVVTAEGDRLVVAFDRHWWYSMNVWAPSGSFTGRMTKDGNTLATLRSSALPRSWEFYLDAPGCK